MNGVSELESENLDVEETRRTIHEIRKHSSARGRFIDDLEEWQRKVLLHQLLLNYEGVVEDGVVENLIASWAD